MDQLNYLKTFKCIGNLCEDNCCVGWSVDIDEKTYKKYVKLKHPELKSLIKTHLYFNENMINPAIDYGKLALTESKRCPFLNDSDLCNIHLKIGENSLSNVCKFFPRIINRINGTYEMSATPSCPEVARLLLLSIDACEIAHLNNTLSFPLLTYDHKDSEHKGIFSKVFEVRNQVIKIFNNQEKNIEENLTELAIYINSIDNKCKIKAKVVSELNLYDLADILIKRLNQDPSIKGTRYDAMKSLTMVKISDKSLEQYETYFTNRKYLLKNYFVNEVYQNLFPYTDSKDFFSSYLYLLGRYAMIKRQLLGLAAHYNGLNDEIVLNYISAFSKTVDHHYAFKQVVIDHMSENY